MRVVFDGYWWVHGPQSMANVLRGVVRAWASEFPEDELILVVRRRHIDQVGALPSNVMLRTSRLFPQALLAALAVPWWARRTRADAMLVHSFAPLFGHRRATLLHDAMYMTNPEWFTGRELLYFRWMARLAGRAHVVFATSQTEAARILEHTSARQVVAVGMGLEPELIEGPMDPVPGLVPERFMLVVGRLNVRKNLAATLDGARLSGRLSTDYPAVVVGERHGANLPFPSWVDEYVRSGSVRFPGFVTNSQLAWLLRNCGLFVSLSLDEGFGLPPVEARAVGASVLVSDRAIFRETLEQHADFVDPTDTEAIAAAIRQLTASSTKSDDVARARADLLGRYNWPATVRRMRAEVGGLGGGDGAGTPLHQGAPAVAHARRVRRP